MHKEAYYFQHDYDAINDPKITALILKFGAEGYGIYWRVVEILHTNSDHKIEKQGFTYAAIAQQLNTTAARVEEVINYASDFCKLFNQTAQVIESERVNRNFDKRKLISEARSTAGKQGMENRWADNKPITKNNKTVLLLTKNNKGKERKEKEKKEKGFSPSGVFPSQDLTDMVF